MRLELRAVLLSAILIASPSCWFSGQPTARLCDAKYIEPTISNDDFCYQITWGFKSAGGTQSTLLKPLYEYPRGAPWCTFEPRGRGRARLLSRLSHLHAPPPPPPPRPRPRPHPHPHPPTPVTHAHTHARPCTLAPTDPRPHLTTLTHPCRLPARPCDDGREHRCM